MEELSLVFFTVLAQTAAGTALVLAIVACCFDNNDRRQISLPGYISVLVLLGMAGVASLTHLGHPLRAMNVVFGLSHGSPLSLEILAVALFGAVISLLLGLMFIKHPLANKPTLPIIGGFTGMLMVYAISRVYNIQTIDVWYHLTTPLQFFATATVMGACIVSLLATINGVNSVLIRGLSVVSLIFVFIVISIHQQYLGSLANMLDVADAQSLIWFRYGLLACGCFLWLFPMLAKQNGGARFIASGGVLILLSELAGRAYFYDLINQRLL